ncbi:MULTISPECIES: hypothetical protein [unclassified Xanthobacter]|uniref:hypothetical protein n=1 Tax=unclassified Xanthobacter TaxID=2623496 RepID=UPI001F452336|nr:MULTISPECIES: hypothetical protein [unclassified Xanthobacter]
MASGYEQVQVQFQNKTGNWSTVIVTQNLPADILNAMKSVAQANPGCRVRAVDSVDRVVDIL